MNIFEMSDAEFNNLSPTDRAQALLMGAGYLEAEWRRLKRARAEYRQAKAEYQTRARRQEELTRRLAVTRAH